MRTNGQTHPARMNKPDSEFAQLDDWFDHTIARATGNRIEAFQKQAIDRLDLRFPSFTPEEESEAARPQPGETASESQPAMCEVRGLEVDLAIRRPVLVIPVSEAKLTSAAFPLNP